MLRKGSDLRRLFSSFARGWPGSALLLMRLVAAVALFQQLVHRLEDAAPIKSTTFAILGAIAAALLLAGLWTPIAGALAALVELLCIASHLRDPWTYILLATFGISLALLGPGAWSVDAYLFGWKRIDIGPRPG